MEAPTSMVYVLFCRLVEVGSWNPIIYKVFIHPRSCRISSINSISYVPLSFVYPTPKFDHCFFQNLDSSKVEGVYLSLESSPKADVLEQ